MSLDYRIGDVFDRLAEIGDGTIDLIVTSPPFLALRSYLPADHPDKHCEIGSEATPAAFIDTLLALTAEFGRVLAPHGSLCVELGDTFSGSHAEGPVDGESTTAGRANNGRTQDSTLRQYARSTGGDGWPLAKSLTGIPTLYPWSLAYGRNLLTGQESPAGRWRIRNIIVWARPNPPVGALGDKFRPATSYITIACQGARRFFDLDAVRTAYDGNPPIGGSASRQPRSGETQTIERQGLQRAVNGPVSNPAGAPPLDWHTDLEDGDWLWKLPTQPFKGSHFATFPLELPTRLIRAMCPLRVCTLCGKPSERITGDVEYVPSATNRGGVMVADATRNAERANSWSGDNGEGKASVIRNAPTLGWSDCGHDAWRTGVVLDPFAGSGTTVQAAQNVGRHAIGIDLDETNADLARSRVGMFLEIETPKQGQAVEGGDTEGDARPDPGIGTDHHGRATADACDGPERQEFGGVPPEASPNRQVGGRGVAALTAIDEGEVVA